jgi:hypothetical protein
MDSINFYWGPNYGEISSSSSAGWPD